MRQFKGRKHQAGFIGEIIGAVIGAVASKKASKTQAKAAKDAGQFQLQAAQESIAEQRRQFDIAQENQKPWMEAGRRSLGTMEGLLRGPPKSKYAKFTGTPGWKPKSQAPQFQAPQNALQQSASKFNKAGLMGLGAVDYVKLLQRRNFS